MTQIVSLRDFRTGNIVGEGGFSQVFQGFWSKQKVAIKKFIPSSYSTSEKYQKGFDNETKLQGQCSSPYIVALLAICIENSSAFYAIQEYAEGGDLRTVLKDKNPKRLSSYILWTIIADAVSALDYIHARGIVHNDIKPENILLTQDNHGKITDFGISTLSGTKTAAGTSQYIAPECYKKLHIRREKSDIYSLGMVMWEVWCGNGKIPFSDFRQQYGEKHKETIPIDKLNKAALMAMRRYIALENGTEVIPDQTTHTTAKIIRDCWEKEDVRPTARVLLWGIFGIRENEKLQTIHSTTTTEKATQVNICLQNKVLYTSHKPILLVLI